MVIRNWSFPPMRLRGPRYDVPENVRRQLRRRRWTRRGVFAGLFLLALSVVVGRSGCYRGDDWTTFDKQAAIVSHVIDGDTVRIRIGPDSTEETVRLLGIDAPEITHGPATQDAYWGPESAAYLKGLVEGKSVTLRLDTTQTRDRYQRLLAYLYERDIDNLNLRLVRDGQAYAHRLYPHSMIRQFEQAEDEARGKQRGLWADLREEQMPAWRRQWLTERRAGKSARP